MMMNDKKPASVQFHFYIVAGLIWLKLLLLRGLFFDRIAWEWIAADIAPVLLIMGVLAVITPGRMKGCLLELQRPIVTTAVRGQCVLQPLRLGADLSGAL
ncbi:hypothetical protein [Paenibacillus rhizoplanae]|uniref:hypothetical protein n=1 Tax=Paenibacillus rhizoplanae TaxID=1917181 RepID=UPI0036087239